MYPLTNTGVPRPRKDAMTGVKNICNNGKGVVWYMDIEMQICQPMAESE